jgi:thioredoxin-related protein
VLAALMDLPYFQIYFMKTIVLTAAVFLLLNITEWLTDFKQAKSLAAESKKVILLNFSGSDWCGPCIKMKRDIFETQEFKDFAGKELILLKADFPRQKKNQLPAELKVHNEKLAEQYNPKGKFPLTLLLDAEGRVLREWDGYNGMSSAEFIKQVSTSFHGK